VVTVSTAAQLPPRTVRALAELAGVLLVVVVVAIVPLAYAAHTLIDSLYPIAFAPAFGAVGVVIALRQPRNAIGWLLIGVGLLVGGSFDVETYAYLVYRLGDHGLPLGRIAVFLAPCWYPGIVLLPLPILLFPDGRLPSARWRPVLAVYLATGAALVATITWLDLPALLDRSFHVDSSGQLRAIDYPTGWESFVLHASLIPYLGFLLIFVVRQVINYRRSAGIPHQQLKSLLSGGGICLAGLLGSIVLGALPGHVWYVISNAAFLAIVALPISIGVGILRYRLYEIDRLVSRTLSYAILTAMLVGVYLGVVTLATRALPLSSPIGVAASTLAAAALFNPLRRRTQRLVDRRFNRARYDAEATVAAFASQLRGAIDLESVESRLVDAVRQAVEPASAAVWIRVRES
jgi:hypothetical protein